MDRYIGKKLDGRYKLTERIGEGGMAYVYKAEDLLTGTQVAVKVMKDELSAKSDLVRRFRNESKAIGLLDHDNIVKVLDVNYSDQVQYIVMELLDGVTLKDYINANKPVSWKNAVFITEQLLKALQHAHDRGIIHRDIKPQNVMLSAEGKVKVMDFGIARFSRSRVHTITDKAIGTVHYISPEQAKGEECDARSDLYSVGVMMYEMCTGQLPFDGDSAVSIALMQISEEVRMPRSINPDIPEGLEEIIVRAMEKDPDKRYQSAGAMLLDIQEFRRNPAVNFLYRTGAAEAAKAAAKAAEEEKNAAPAAEQPDGGKGKDVAAAGAAAAAVVSAAAGMTGEMPAQAEPAEEKIRYRSDTPPIDPKEEIMAKKAAEKAARKADRAAAKAEKEKKKAAAKTRKATQKAADKKYKKKTINLPLAILMGFSAVVLIAAVILAVMTLQNSGSQIFVKHDDVDLPTFIGMTRDQITKDPAYAMFNIKYVEDYNSEYEVGVVFDQTPVAPKIVKDNANITLYVSRGPKIVSVPDIVGLTYGEAMRLLQAQGLSVNRMPDSNEEYGGNVITRVEPEAGTPVESGSTVMIYVNSPITSLTTRVPDVVTMDFTTAKATLIMMGLQVGEITEGYDPTVEPGVVIFQSIEPETEVANGTLVDLVLATNIGTFERSFTVSLPYKDADGYSAFNVVFLDEEGNTIYTENNRTKRSGVTLTRVGTLDETVRVRLNGRDYQKLLLNYQDGTFSVLEDYSAKNGFVSDRATYSVSVDYGEGGTVNWSSSVLDGDDCVVTINPGEGYALDRIYDNGTDVTGEVFNGKYTIQGVDRDHTITVTFKLIGI